MSIDKVILRTSRIVAVLPQYVKPDMENVVALLGEQQAQIKAQAETILEQREQIAILRATPTAAKMALTMLTQKQPLNAEDMRWAWNKAKELGFVPDAEAWQEASRDMVI